ncbi:TetR family transcriptional regulator [Nocardia abscessus]|uniref:TetR family transcriptional regulator n=1 Tax=Nocardia abscessus TaxID=120957 RepID=UPI0018944425|nr:TetR family transcriptional regulator [Nocardia abscessus]MBF6217467.1 TetR family transcriptional regulator [Nocardia abscessus]
MRNETEDAAPHAAIRRARRATGLSLREVARRLEVSPATLSAVETGKTGISIARLSRLADVLGVPVAQLLGATSSPAGPISRPADTSGAQGGWRAFDPLHVDPVLAAAIASFVEIGYHGTTVRALARRAGTSVPGLYHHYRDKHDLLVRILDLTMDELHWRVRAARAEGRDSIHRVRLIVEALALFHTHRRELGFIGASEMRSLSSGERARIARSRRDIQAILDDAIAEASAEGRVATRDTGAAGRAIATMCTAIPQWFRESGPATPEEVAAQYGDFALGVLGADPARQPTLPP